MTTAVVRGRDAGRAPMAASLGLAAILAAAVPLVVTAQDDAGAPGLEPPLEMIWEASLPSWDAAEDTGAPAWGVSVDPQGRIWVATVDSVLEIFDRDGAHQETFGAPGSGEGQFDFVNQYGNFGDVAFLPDGGFYVSDVDNARIQQFDAEREFVRAVGSFGGGDGQFAGPDTIRLDGAGNLYVMDPVRGDIQVFDGDLNHLRTFGYGEVGPFLGVDPDGTVYAADEDALELVAHRPDGSSETVASLAGLMSFITGIARTVDGRTYVASELSGVSETGPENLAEIAADGTVTHLWPHGGWHFALDPDGDRIYIGTDKLRAYALPAE